METEDAASDSFGDLFMASSKKVKKSKKKDSKKSKHASAKEGKCVTKVEKKKSKNKKKKRKRDLQDIPISLRNTSSKPVVESECTRYEDKPTIQPTYSEHSFQKQEPGQAIGDLLRALKKTTKRKKKVAFVLSPSFIPAKHPRGSESCSSRSPVQEREDDTMVEGAGCGQRLSENSQAAADDDNSEDLFITQKTFRVSSSESSSCDLQLPSTPRRPREPAEPVPTRATLEAATQTENFFTTELSRYLSFHLHTEASTSSADLQPVDLSLPCRLRAQPNPPPLTSTSGVTVNIPPGSESTDNSSESNDSFWKRKLEASQANAVQMRLNESFFFKIKGPSKEPRPQSPLLKLEQSREKKPK